MVNVDGAVAVGWRTMDGVLDGGQCGGWWMVDGASGVGGAVDGVRWVIDGAVDSR